MRREFRFVLVMTLTAVLATSGIPAQALAEAIPQGAEEVADATDALESAGNGGSAESGAAEVSKSVDAVKEDGATEDETTNRVTVDEPESQTEEEATDAADGANGVEDAGETEHEDAVQPGAVGSAVAERGSATNETPTGEGEEVPQAEANADDANAGDASEQAAVDEVSITRTRRYDLAFEVLEHVNAERAKEGLAAITMDEALMEGAMTRAGEVVARFDHTRPDGTPYESVWDGAGASDDTAEENGATTGDGAADQSGAATESDTLAGDVASAEGATSAEHGVRGESIARDFVSAQECVDSWLAQDVDAKDIMDPGIGGLGVGVVEVGGSLYWVQLLGESGPDVSCSQPENATGSQVLHLERGAYAALLNAVSSMAVGESQDATITISCEATESAFAPDAESVEWNTSNAEVAGVTALGSVQAKAVGTAIISVSAGELQASQLVTVSDAPMPEADVAAQGDDPTLPEVPLKAAGKTSIEKATIASVGVQTYTGNAIKPTPTVKLDGKTLTKDKDYTLSYTNNVNVGTATITATGKGNYTGTASTTFKIVRNIADATVAAVANQAYTGAAIKPTPAVKLDGKTLTKDTDYTLSYTNNVNVGTATITATGKGNYTGTASKTFKIVAASIEKATIASVGVQTYTGKAIKPTPAVKLDGKTLTKDKDYTLSYKNNINVGTATITATGTGNYKGAASTTFKIARNIADATVAAVANQAYTGAAIKPTPAVKLGDTTLKKDTDYTLSYASNTDPGTAKITVTGKGNFTGTKTCTFTITAPPVAGTVSITRTRRYDLAFSILSLVNKERAKKNLQPLTMKAELMEAAMTRAGELVARSDNTRPNGVRSFSVAPTAKAENTATNVSTAQACMNLWMADGSSKANNLDSASKGLGVGVVKVGDKFFWVQLFSKNGPDKDCAKPANATGSQELALEDGSFTAKLNASSPMLADASQNATVTVTCTKTKDSFKPDAKSFTWSSSAAKVAGVTSAGVVQAKRLGKTTIKALTGKLQASASITVDPIPMANTAIDLYASRVYTGSAVDPQPVVKRKGVTLTKDKDYTVSYKNNVNVGTATATFTGKGLFTGTRSATFKVVAASVANASVSGLGTYCYTGKAVKPKPTVKVGKRTLKLDQDYKLTYANNTKAGTATVTITGKGNYKGSKKCTFKIVAPSVQYFVHRQTYGWEKDWSKANGDQSGTTGESKRLEGIKIRLNTKPLKGSIEYRTHIQTYGWEVGWKKDGEMSGTSGQSKRLEAIQIRLTDNMAKHYDVFYRVHAQKFGWMSWAKNGANSGTAGYSYRLEAIQIVILPKGSSAPPAEYKGATSNTPYAFAKRG